MTAVEQKATKGRAYEHKSGGKWNEMRVFGISMTELAIRHF
jgi:hypothetical protein